MDELLDWLTNGAAHFEVAGMEYGRATIKDCPT